MSDAARPKRSEFRSHVVRIASNYARLGSTLAIGITVVPLMFRWLGDEAFGLVSLLGANIGLAAIFRQIMQQSLVRELGSSYHAGDAAFRRAYAALYRLAAVFAFLTAVTFGIVVLLVPYFRIPPELLGAARWFVVAEGVQTAVMILLSPALNMFLVIERFTAYSVWFVSLRATQLVAVLALGYVLRIDDPATGLLLLGLSWAGMSVLTYIGGVIYLVRQDRRLMPTARKPEEGALREVLGTFSWNSGVQVAMNFHEQIPPVLLNLLAGPLANAAWGVGFRLVAYIRMVTTGMQFGSDAVSARLAKNGDEESMHQLRRLVSMQTRLTSVVSLPAGAAVFLYAFPVLHLWVGGQVENYEAVMPDAVLMARVLAAALAARAVSDTWIIVLYGAGFVRSYAPLVIAGGLLAPIAGFILMKTLPPHLVTIGPAIAFTGVFVGLHLLVVPVIAGRCLRMSPLLLFRSLMGPAAATMLGSVAALSVLGLLGEIDSLSFASTPTSQLGSQIRPVPLVASMIAYGLVMATAMYRLGLQTEDRARFARLFRSITARLRP
jgi:O-antigen/teichoic acid export membrane protein